MKWIILDTQAREFSALAGNGERADFVPQTDHAYKFGTQKEAEEKCVALNDLCDVCCEVAEWSPADEVSE